MKTIDLETAKEIGNKLGVDFKTIEPEQFRQGMNVELEHGKKDPQTNVTGDNLTDTGKIAWQHLKESPDYYRKLKKVEAGILTRQQIIRWLEEVEFDGEGVEEGLLGEINKNKIEIIEKEVRADPFAGYRPQNLFYVVGSINFGEKYFAVVWGTDEGFSEGNYTFAFAKTKKELPTFDTWIGQGPGEEDPDLPEYQRSSDKYTGDARNEAYHEIIKRLEFMNISASPSKIVELLDSYLTEKTQITFKFYDPDREGESTFDWKKIEEALNEWLKSQLEKQVQAKTAQFGESDPESNLWLALKRLPQAEDYGLYGFYEPGANHFGLFLIYFPQKETAELFPIRQDLLWEKQFPKEVSFEQAQNEASQQAEEFYRKLLSYNEKMLAEAVRNETSGKQEFEQKMKEKGLDLPSIGIKAKRLQQIKTAQEMPLLEKGLPFSELYNRIKNTSPDELSEVDVVDFLFANYGLTPEDIFLLSDPGLAGEGGILDWGGDSEEGILDWLHNTGLKKYVSQLPMKWLSELSSVIFESIGFPPNRKIIDAFSKTFPISQLAPTTKEISKPDPKFKQEMKEKGLDLGELGIQAKRRQQLKRIADQQLHQINEKRFWEIIDEINLSEENASLIYTQLSDDDLAHFYNILLDFMDKVQNSKAMLRTIQSQGRAGDYVVYLSEAVVALGEGEYRKTVSTLDVLDLQLEIYEGILRYPLLEEVEKRGPGALKKLNEIAGTDYDIDDNDQGENTIAEQKRLKKIADYYSGGYEDRERELVELIESLQYGSDDEQGAAREELERRYVLAGWDVDVLQDPSAILLIDQFKDRNFISTWLSHSPLFTNQNIKNEIPEDTLKEIVESILQLHPTTRAQIAINIGEDFLPGKKTTTPDSVPSDPDPKLKEELKGQGLDLEELGIRAKLERIKKFYQTQDPDLEFIHDVEIEPLKDYTIPKIVDKDPEKEKALKLKQIKKFYSKQSAVSENDKRNFQIALSQFLEGEEEESARVAGTLKTDYGLTTMDLDILNHPFFLQDMETEDVKTWLGNSGLYEWADQIDDEIISDFKEFLKAGNHLEDQYVLNHFVRMFGMRIPGAKKVPIQEFLQQEKGKKEKHPTPDPKFKQEMKEKGLDLGELGIQARNKQHRRAAATEYSVEVSIPDVTSKSVPLAKERDAIKMGERLIKDLGLKDKLWASDYGMGYRNLVFDFKGERDVIDAIVLGITNWLKYQGYEIGDSEGKAQVNVKLKSPEGNDPSFKDRMKEKGLDLGELGIKGKQEQLQKVSVDKRLEKQISEMLYQLYKEDSARFQHRLSPGIEILSEYVNYVLREPDKYWSHVPDTERVWSLSNAQGVTVFGLDIGNSWYAILDITSPPEVDLDDIVTRLQRFNNVDLDLTDEEIQLVEEGKLDPRDISDDLEKESSLKLSSRTIEILIKTGVFKKRAYQELHPLVKINGEWVPFTFQIDNEFLAESTKDWAVRVYNRDFKDWTNHQKERWLTSGIVAKEALSKNQVDTVYVAKTYADYLTKGKLKFTEWKEDPYTFLEILNPETLASFPFANEGIEHIREMKDPQQKESALKVDLVHYTAAELLKWIKKEGLKSSEKGSLGEGTYFWVSKPLTIADVPAGNIALRIKPNRVAAIVDIEAVLQSGIGSEFVLDDIPPKDLQILTANGWEDLKLKQSSKENGWLNPFTEFLVKYETETKEKLAKKEELTTKLTQELKEKLPTNSDFMITLGSGSLRIRKESENGNHDRTNYFVYLVDMEGNQRLSGYVENINVKNPENLTNYILKNSSLIGMETE